MILILFSYKKEIYIKKLKINIICNFYILTTLMEIYNRKLYLGLNNLNCILDLGAYIGESSLYLAYNKNNKIICFEPSIEKFKLLQKNIKNIKNIIGFNYALTNYSKKNLIFY